MSLKKRERGEGGKGWEVRGKEEAVNWSNCKGFFTSTETWMANWYSGRLVA